MKTAPLLLVSILSLCGAAIAQNAPLTGISESTDPQKISEVERRAEEVKAAAQQSRQQPTRAYPRSSGSSEIKSPKPRKKARKAKLRHSATTA